MATEVRVGCAGWSIPGRYRTAFEAEGSALERYASRLSVAEINSSFYRAHQPATYARWAAAVPAHFRFTPEQIKKEMVEAGYVMDAEHDFLPRQHFLIFR